MIIYLFHPSLNYPFSRVPYMYVNSLIKLFSGVHRNLKFEEDGV